MSRWYPALGQWRALFALLAMLRVLVACSCDDNEKKGGSRATGPEPPVITVPEDGTVTSDDWLDVSGTAEDDTEIELFADDESVANVDTEGGDWNAVLVDLAEGEYVLTATATDRYRRTSDPSEPVTVIIDRTDPEEPVIEAPEDGADLTESTVVFSGTAEPDSEIELSEGGDVIGTATADEDGQWSIEVELEDGSYGVSATSTDAAGNFSRSDTVFVTVDTVAPDPPTITRPEEDEILSYDSVVVQGEGDEGTEIEIFLDGESVGTTETDSSGNWGITLGAVGEGEHELEAVAIDEVGNESDASDPVVFVVDTVAPNAPVIESPENGELLDDDTPEISGTADPGAEVTLYADSMELGTTTADDSGDWSFTSPPLSDGNYALVARVTDDAGNTVSSAPVSIGIDTTAYDPPVIESPANGSVTDDSTPVVSGAGYGTVEVYDSDGTTVLGTVATYNGHWALTSSSLVDGEHTLTARSIDQAGNVSDPSSPVVIAIDTMDPVVDAGTDRFENAGFTQDATASDANQLSYAWSQESGPGTLTFGTADAEDTTIGADTDGTYTVRLTVTDVAGHSAFDEMTLVWDTLPPEIIAMLPDADASNVDVNTSVRVTFSEAMNAATFDGIVLDGGSVAGTTSAPTPSVGVFAPSSALSADTTYTVTVNATVTDLAGNPVAATNWDFTTAVAGLPEVESFYAGGWNDYVKDDGADRFDASGTPCDGSETGGYSACIHVGEMLMVDTGDSTCGNKAASDALGAFDWVCDDSTGSALMVSTGLADGVMLSDLLDFQALSFKPNSITVTGTGGDAPFTTADSIWWDNPVLLVEGGGTLDTQGGIYLVTEDLDEGLELGADKVALVVEPGFTLSGGIGYYQSAVTALDRNFLWVEAAAETESGTALYLDRCTFSVARGVTVTGTGIPYYYYYYYSGRGMTFDGGGNNFVTNVSISNLYYGVRLEGTTQNQVSDVTVSNCTVGAALVGGSQNTVSDILTNDSEYGVIVSGSSDNVLSDITARDGRYGILVNYAADNDLSYLVAEGNSEDGINLYYAFRTSLSNAEAARNGNGVAAFDVNDARLSNISSSQNTSDGIAISSYWVHLEGVTAFGNGGVGLRLYGGNRSTVVDGTFASNELAGFFCDGCVNGVFSGITAANNGSHGVYLSGSAANAIMGITAVNNGADGVRLDSDYGYYYFYNDANLNLVSNVVSAHNANYGLALDHAPDNQFTGALVMGGNGAGDCYVDAESLSGDLADDAAGDDATHDGECNTTSASLSDFTFTTGVSLAGSFVGKVGTGGLVDTSGDDQNPHDDSTPGQASFASVLDFTSFENPYRGWGLDGSVFPNADQRGSWTTGTGRIWDFSAALGDTGDGGSPVLWNVRGLPDGDTVHSIDWYRYAPPVDQADCDGIMPGSVYGASVCTSTFLRNAVEISGDDVGNDNMLCETGETCLFTPNVGSYQGHGALQSAGAFVGGTLTGVTLQEYAGNGY